MNPRGHGEPVNGRAYVYYGSASGTSLTADWMVESKGLFDEFGDSVATAGDVNGDGYDDVIVGAPYYSVGQDSDYAGAAFVYHGSASGLSLEPNWIAVSNQRGGFGNEPLFQWV